MNQPATHQSEPAENSYRLTIAVLSITAVILLVGVLVVTTISQTASAIGQTDRGGDYIVVTTQFNTGTEHVMVTDAAVEKTLAYGWNVSTRRVDMVADILDLKRFKEQGARPDKERPKRGYRP